MGSNLITLNQKNKDLTQKLHHETKKLTERIDRVELIQNRPILVSIINYKPHDPKNEQNKKTYSKFIGEYHCLYSIKNEGMIAVENWFLNTYYLISKILYCVEFGEWTFSGRKTSIRLSLGETKEMYPALICVNNQEKDLNLLYDEKYPR